MLTGDPDTDAEVFELPALTAGWQGPGQGSVVWLYRRAIGKPARCTALLCD
jgi:hypothetical protein